uniref:RNA polymerase sigma factor n=1 Tax=Acetatifactor sp. TaxID=1872090 RepID=UPI004056704F
MFANQSLDLEEQYDKIYRYCYFKVRKREVAEDITQEAFLRFYEKFGLLLRYVNEVPVLVICQLFRISRFSLKSITLARLGAIGLLHFSKDMQAKDCLDYSEYPDGNCNLSVHSVF